MSINSHSNVLEDDEETEGEDEFDEDYIPMETTPSPPPFLPPPIIIVDDEEEEQRQQQHEEEEEEEEEEEQEQEEEQENATTSANTEQRSEGGEKGRVETDPGSFSCPVCMEPWSSEGAHRTCCLPCGHVYGRSCIERWIQQSGKTIGRCTLCNQRCKLTEIRNIYAPRLAVVNDGLLKEVISLRDENEFLKVQPLNLHSESSQNGHVLFTWEECGTIVVVPSDALSDRTHEKVLQVYVTKKRRNTSLLEEVRLHKKHKMDRELHEKKKATRIEQVSSGMMQTRPFENAGERRASEEQILSERSTALHISGRSSHAYGSIALKAELGVDGARVFDMDVLSQILVVCRRPSRIAGMHELTKISLLSLDENENIPLPSGKKPIKDIRISPLSRRLALLASMEKTISIFSMGTNNIAQTYNLPAPAWSCSWDVNNPNHAYAGLQNGMLTVLDLRQTREPVECINGLSSHPVHTIHSIVYNRDRSPSTAAGRLLTASSLGLSQWNIGGVAERPYLIPGMENQGVCISLAYCDAGDIVASFRPRLHVPNDIMPSQPSISPPPTVSGPVTWGSHVLLKRVDEISYQNHGFTLSNVSAVRMPKSTIISKDGHRPLFVCGDEATNGLCMRDLPSLGVIDNLKQHSHPILDVKYAGSIDTGLLGCISEDRLQLFTCFDN